jgi:hypothetical protein
MASSQTELAAEYSLHTACAWNGYAKGSAAGHSLQVTDADWQRHWRPGISSGGFRVKSPSPDCLITCFLVLQIP